MYRKLILATLFSLLFILVLLIIRCRFDKNHKYIAEIIYDGEDIEKVWYEKTAIGTSSSSSVYPIIARSFFIIELGEIDAKKTESITLFFKSKRYGDIKFRDASIEIGKHVKFFCEKDKVVKMTITTPYM